MGGLQNGETVSVLGAGPRVLHLGRLLEPGRHLRLDVLGCARLQLHHRRTSTERSPSIAAALTITASSAPMSYGSTPPTITASYDGFVNGDSAASLTTGPTCSTTATSSSPVGTYDSSCSGAVRPELHHQLHRRLGDRGRAASLIITASSTTDHLRRRARRPSRPPTGLRER